MKHSEDYEISMLCFFFKTGNFASHFIPIFVDLSRSSAIAQIKATHVPEIVWNFRGDRLIINTFIAINLVCCFFGHPVYSWSMFVHLDHSPYWSADLWRAPSPLLQGDHTITSPSHGTQTCTCFVYQTYVYVIQSFVTSTLELKMYFPQLFFHTP